VYVWPEWSLDIANNANLCMQYLLLNVIARFWWHQLMCRKSLIWTFFGHFEIGFRVWPLGGDNYKHVFCNIFCCRHDRNILLFCTLKGKSMLITYYMSRFNPKYNLTGSYYRKKKIVYSAISSLIRKRTL
jgi:hypothetical protein